MSKHRKPAKGFILLMTVVLLLVAGLTAASISSRSVAGALEVRRLENQLQERWARVSLQRALLGRAEMIFDRLDMKAPANADGEASVSAAMLVGGKVYHIQLADEQAKLNLLTGLRAGRLADTERAANGLGVKLRSEVALRIESVLQPRQPRESLWPLRSWPTLLDRAEITGRLDALELQRITTDVTLWGDGKLHWRRAKPSVVKALQDMLGLQQDLTRLVREWKENPDLQEPSHPVLTDGSQCYSLWIIPEKSSGMIAFSVRFGPSGTTGTTESFVW